MDKILLIDLHNQLWRASVNFSNIKHIECNYCEKFKALHDESKIHCVCGENWIVNNNICSDNGKNILVYNFFRNLRPLIEKFSPDKCFFALEGYPKFRYDIYPEYKSNRIVKTGSKKQEDFNKFHEAKIIVTDLLRHFPITLVKADNFEADDVIFSLVESMKDENITIISNDNDYKQLLQKKYIDCKIYNPIKKEFMENLSVNFVAFRSLTGDKSDSIPGLISENKAMKLLSDPNLFKQFMSIEENRANFSINKSLIEFRQISDEELLIEEGIKNFSFVKEKFSEMKFDSIINDKFWKKFTETFDCLKF